MLKTALQLADILVDGKIGLVGGYPGRLNASALGETAAPCAARLMAIAFPIPLLAPVTTAV